MLSVCPRFMILVCCYAFLGIYLLPTGVAGLKNGLALTPPMGWSTWCTDNGVIPCHNDFCNETEIRSIADSMVKNGLVQLGYNHILLDDCWAGGRDAQGNLFPEADRFPSGMPALVKYIHQRGLRLGLYTDVGKYTCIGHRPGSWDHYKQDALTFASWQVDMVKVDWCNRPGGYTARQLYTKMRDALNATGHPMLFSVCEWGLQEPWTWGAETANMWRVGPDHLPVWWTPNTPQDPGQGQGTANIIQHMAGKSMYAGPGAWNDMDFLEPGYFWNGPEDDLTAFSFWCLFGAPLFVATDVRVLQNKRCILNQEAIAVNQDSLGLTGDLRVNNTHTGGQIWSRPLSGPVPAWAVILYNSRVNGSQPIAITLPFNNSTLPGWPLGGTESDENFTFTERKASRRRGGSQENSVKIRDINTHRDLGEYTDRISVQGLAPHGVRFLKVTLN